MASDYATSFSLGPNLKKWLVWMPLGFLLGSTLILGYAAMNAAPVPVPITVSNNSQVLYASGTVQNSTLIGSGLYSVTMALAGGSGTYTFASPHDLTAGTYVIYSQMVDPVFVPLLHPLGGTAPNSFIEIAAGTTPTSAVYSPSWTFSTDPRVTQFYEALAFDGVLFALVLGHDVRRELPDWRKNRALSAFEVKNAGLKYSDPAAYNKALTDFARERRASAVLDRRKMLVEAR